MKHATIFCSSIALTVLIGYGCNFEYPEWLTACALTGYISMILYDVFDML